MPGSIVGKVINQQDGQNLSGTGLKLTGEGAGSNAVSNDSGDFQFDGLAAGKYELVAVRPGFESGIYGPLVVVDGVPTEIMIALQPSPP